MEFTSIKQTLIGFAVFLTILLGSCTEEITAPPNNPPPPDYMSFTLTNSTGTTVATSTSLSRSSTYGLVITPASGTTIPTADYTITHTPTDAIIIDTRLSNSIDFTVDNTAATSITVTVTHRTNSAVSESITLNLASQLATTSFQQNIENATSVPNLILANALTREVLSPLSPLGSLRGGAVLEKRYVTTNGGATTQDGTSWATAWAATNLRNAITNINNATANRVYLVMVAGGTYKPTDDRNRNISFRMTNYVAIMGGFDSAGGWGRTGTTIFSGDIGTIGSANDNSYQVFSHTSITLGNAHLYGVTITEGNANGGTAAQENGGGMYNSGSSPVLTEVVFSENRARNGGGIYNSGSSPVLTKVLFSGNSTGNDGGGMLNTASSSPMLTRVVFNGNTANGSGGGMFNNNSSPVLTSVVFSQNHANSSGGAMINNNSSFPIMLGSMFSENTANNGGAMLNNNSSSPVMGGTVFSENTSTVNGGAMLNNNSSSPIMLGSVFSGNITTGNGGAMVNWKSSPVIIGAVFRNNSAANGGGMYNDNGGTVAGPLIVNTIFSSNTLSGVGNGTNIAMDSGGFTGTETIRIAGSVLGTGLAQPTNAIVGYGGSDALNINYHSLTNGPVNFGVDATFIINEMNFTYPTITASSSAINLGLYTWWHVNTGVVTYYFSEIGSGTSWHTNFTSTGGFAGTAENLPTTGIIEDLTATDLAGNTRNGRPDAGVFELR